MARSTDPRPLPCDVLADDLEWYLDDLDGSDGTDEGLPPLPEERHRAVEAHLERCPACSRQLARAARVRDELRALPAEVSPRTRPTAPPAVEDRRAMPPPPPWRRALPWLTTAAGALVVILAAVTMLQPLLQPRPPAPTAQELARAEAEARYALAQLAEVTRRVGRHLQEDVLVERLMEPTTRHLRDSLAAPIRRSPALRPTPDSSTTQTPELPREPGR